MGFRNPFRMSVDKPTGIVYLGDYGPDAGGADANRGPGGQVEFNRITAPGNYGWPYCTGTNTHHRDLQRVDTSPTGPPPGRSTTAPAARPTTRSATPARPRCRRPSRAGSGTASTPAHRRSSAAAASRRWAARSTATTPALNSPVKFPQSLDGRYFAGEYGRRWIKAIAVNANGTYGEISGVPVDRHPGHGHGVRPGRRAVRARLRHRRRTTRRCTGSSTSAAATAARSRWRRPTGPPARRR